MSQKSCAADPRGPRLSLRDRFERSYIPEPNSGCWLWMKSISGNGYGQMFDYGTKRPMPAHRVSHLLFKGNIPQKNYVLHSCDNKLCVNPDHLSVGTPSRNIKESYQRARRRSEFSGRTWWELGHSHPQQKRGFENVARIIKR